MRGAARPTAPPEVDGASALRPPSTPPDFLALVVELQAEVADLHRRLEAAERALRLGGIPPKRRLSLAEAARRGLLPRGIRTIQAWMARPELRERWKPDLFLTRVAGRVEIDLDGLEEWRRQMAAPATPRWPIRWGAAERSAS